MATNSNNNNNNDKDNDDDKNNNNNNNSNNDNDTGPSPGDGGVLQPPQPPSVPNESPSPHAAGNQIIKSGPLFLSSKGIGWTSWKKRWFILTRTSLVFFRSDPSAAPQKGSEVNLTLGGIDLNNSGSVVVKADKKLLTVSFPDGREGRTFTLKAETSEDLYEWKNALESALAQAPSAAVASQNGLFKNDQAADGVDGSSEQSKETSKFTVLGRPLMLALEEADGSPSFLEKALKFIEEHGIKTEGILRLAADVEDVERRIREYEQGKTEFSPEEDGHVIGDCVKYVLRELPSCPVPASCCNALLEACRNDRGNRVNAMKMAICETFPEPNRRLLQRILVMMQTVASHKAVNRMSISAVAACMAPLLLRPLLSGDCEIETDFNVGGDGSMQLLKAAAAANHAQAIVITLLEEYDTIFGEGSMSPGLYSDSEDYESEDEELTDDDESYIEDDQESDEYTDDDNESIEIEDDSGDSGKNELSDNEEEGLDEDHSPGKKSSEVGNNSKAEVSSSSVQAPLPVHCDAEKSMNVPDQSKNSSASKTNEPGESDEKSSSLNGPKRGRMLRSDWGRTSAKKNLSMESIHFSMDDGTEIQKLEANKLELQRKIDEEAKINSVLETNLAQRKKALQERRLALVQDVLRLQEQLKKEREKRTVLEARINAAGGPVSAAMDEKTKAEIEEMTLAEAEVNNLKQIVDDLNVRLNDQQHEQNTNDSSKKKDKKKDSESSANSFFGRSVSKDNYADRVDGENEMKYESSMSSKHPPLQPDPSRGSRSKSFATSNSKKSSTKNEGALTKLTNRLPFMKGRSPEVQNSETDKEGQNTEKFRKPDEGNRPDGQQPQTLDRGRSDGHVSFNIDKAQGPGAKPQTTPRTNSR